MRDNKPEGFFYLDHRTVDSKIILLWMYMLPLVMSAIASQY
ncbi:hypothetical protein [Clostridium septicum]|nr:hypothetical protein [Clostridium septicum]